MEEMMEEPKRAPIPEITPEKPSELMINRYTLKSLIQEHRRISMIIQNPDKWLPIIDIREPDVDKGKVFERLVNRQKKLHTEMVKLRNELPALGSQVGHETEPPIRAKPDLEDLEEFFILWHEMERRRRRTETIVIPKPVDEYKVVIPFKPKTTGVLSFNEADQINVFGPEYDSTNASYNFNTLSTDNWIGLDFGHFFIEDNSSIEIGDRFFVACRLKFPFPRFNMTKAGKLIYQFVYTLKMRSYIEAFQGNIYISARKLLDIEGSGTDPSNFSHYTWFDWTGHAKPPDNWAYREREDVLNSESDISIPKGKNITLYILFTVEMEAEGGRADFVWTGEEPLGYFILKTPPNGSVPGVWFNFD